MTLQVANVKTSSFSVFHYAIPLIMTKFSRCPVAIVVITHTLASAVVLITTLQLVLFLSILYSGYFLSEVIYLLEQQEVFYAILSSVEISLLH